MSETSALALGGCESAGADVLADRDAGTFGSSADRREFVVCEPNGHGVASRVAAGRSAEVGHAPRIPYTRSVDTPEFGVYDKGMTSNEAREALTAAIAARTACINAAQQATGRKASALYRQLEDLAAEVDFAARRVEMAVRAENPGMDEASIQQLARRAA
jgi:hypothetical protein